MTRKQSVVIGLILSLCCAIQSNFISTSLHPRFEHHNEVVGKELAVVEGKPYVIDGNWSYWPEFQNRVVFALALRAVSRWSVLTVSQWYLVLRIISAILMYFALWTLLTATAKASPRTAAAALLLFALLLAMHFNHGWEHPSDFLDPIVMAGFIWATLSRRPWVLLTLCVAAAFNRESAVFGGLLWFCVYGITLDWRTGRLPRPVVNISQSLVGVLLMGVAYVAIAGVRFLFGGRAALGTMQHTSFAYWGDWATSIFRNASPSSWAALLMAILLLPLSWIYLNRGWLSAEHRGLLMAALGIFVVSTIFSLLPELRMLIPMTVVLVYVGAATEAARQAPVEALSGGESR